MKLIDDLNDLKDCEIDEVVLGGESIKVYVTDCGGFEFVALFGINYDFCGPSLQLNTDPTNKERLKHGIITDIEYLAAVEEEKIERVRELNNKIKQANRSVQRCDTEIEQLEVKRRDTVKKIKLLNDKIKDVKAVYANDIVEYKND